MNKVIMKSKGFTIVELLVAVTIFSIIAVIIIGAVKGVGDEDMDFSYINPQVETARSQRRMADELSRQNDLMQRRLELLELQKEKDQ